MNDIKIDWSLVYADEENVIGDVDYEKFFREVFKVDCVELRNCDGDAEYVPDALNGVFKTDADGLETVRYWMQINGMDTICYGDEDWEAELEAEGIEEYSGRFEFDGYEFVLTFWNVPVEVEELEAAYV